MIQLTHLGRRSIWSHDNWLPVVAPTSLREPAHRAIPKEAEDWDIERIIRKFADAAERMQAGGMDGIEIESYGHLFDQFYSPTTNFREDELVGPRKSSQILHQSFGSDERTSGARVHFGLKNVNR